MTAICCQFVYILAFAVGLHYAPTGWALLAYCGMLWLMSVTAFGGMISARWVQFMQFCNLVFCAWLYWPTMDGEPVFGEIVFISISIAVVLALLAPFADRFRALARLIPNRDDTLLVVPFEQKEAAKALGARWDSHLRRWYVPYGMDTTPFERWM